MPAHPSPDLHSLLEAAIQAGQRLQEHLEGMDHASAHQDVPPPGDDVVVLSEKYYTVNRYLRFGDEAARWIGCQMVFAVENQLEPDAGELVGKLKYTLEQVIRPAPTWELIETDLKAAAQAIGPPYTLGLHAWARVWAEAWKEVAAAQQALDHDRLISALVIAMGAGVAFYMLNLIPAKHLRSALARRLRDARTPALPDEARARQENPGQTSETTEPPDLPEAVPEYWFELIGEVWFVHFGGEIGLFTDNKGMRCVAKLLSNPQKEVSALELMGVSRKDVAAGRSFGSLENLEGEEDAPAGDSDQPVLDDETQEHYHRRQSELSDELERAREAQNTARVQNLEAEYDALTKEWGAALGLRGRVRRLGPPPAATKAMDAVRMALKRVYDKMAKAPRPMTSLVTHLRQAIQQDGVAYVYRPSPTPPWHL